MNRSFRQARAAHVSTIQAVVAAMLSSCVPSPPAPVPVPVPIPEPRSLLDMDDENVRRGLAIDKQAPFVRVAYQAATDCTYRDSMARLGQPERASRLTLSVNAWRDRLRVTMMHGRTPSMLVIGMDGRLFAFSFVNQLDGQRWTSETYRAKASELIAAETRPGGPAAHMPNQYQGVFPYIVVTSAMPNGLVGSIPDETGQPWAGIVYRGKTVDRGREANLFDLMRSQSGAEEARVGFLIADRATGMPLNYVVRAGYRFQLKLVSCP